MVKPGALISWRQPNLRSSAIMWSPQIDLPQITQMTQMGTCLAHDPPRPFGPRDETTYRKRESKGRVWLSRFRYVDSSLAPAGGRRGGWTALASVKSATSVDEFYSVRNAISGLTRVARKAGSAAASSETTTNAS